jgi:hypothetical protein
LGIGPNPQSPSPIPNYFNKYESIVKIKIHKK